VIQVSICEDLFYLGRFGEADRQAQKMTEVFPDYDGSWILAGMSGWTAFGRIDDAIALFEHALDLNEASVNHAVMAGAYADLENDALARLHLDRAYEIGGAVFTFLGSATFATIKGNHEAAVTAAKKVMVYYPDAAAMRILRDADIRNGNIDAAIARYMQASLNPIGESPIEYDPPHDAKFVLDLAYLYDLKDDHGEAFQWTLDVAAAHIAKRPRLGYLGYDLADVQLALLQDDRDKALRLLNQAADDKWQYLWRFHLANPALDEIRDEPEFQQAVDKIRASLAEQNARLAANQGTATDG
jgi:tetratricopeptide (TPR) repeat protein